MRFGDAFRRAATDWSVVRIYPRVRRLIGPHPFVRAQLLWVNLVTDGPPATALGFNEADPDIMSKPPRKADENLISPWVFFRYMVVGLYVGVATVAGFVVWYTHTEFMGIDLSKDGHTPISFHQLRNWHDCATWKGFQPSPWTVRRAPLTSNPPPLTSNPPPLTSNPSPLTVRRTRSLCWA